jgi:acyl-CoA synthetase (NDP forming)
VRAASSHTAALAAADLVVDALFESTGVIRADTIDEMFDIASCLAANRCRRPPRRDRHERRRPGIWRSTPAAIDLSVVEFSDATRDRLAAFLSSSASLGNPWTWSRRRAPTTIGAQWRPSLPPRKLTRSS